VSYVYCDTECKVIYGTGKILGTFKCNRLTEGINNIDNQLDAAIMVY